VHSAALSSTAVHDNNYTADQNELERLMEILGGR